MADGSEGKKLTQRRVAKSAVVPAFCVGAMALTLQAQPVLAQADSATSSTPDPAPQTAQTGLLETYSPDYFTVFQPETARDMVAQIPGFSLQGGGNQRGFGEASSNLLINGRRPSTKSQSAGEILSQIPARTVIRIEILDGASLDIPGLSGQVVNIVARAIEFSGNWNYALRFEEGTEPQILDGGVTVSGKRGAIDFALTLNSGQFTFSEDSVETFSDGADQRIEDRREDIQFGQTRPGARLNLAWAPEDGQFANHVGNLNVSIDQLNRNTAIRETFEAITPDRTSGQSVADQGRDQSNYEVGADYALPFGSGQLKLIGLLQEQDRMTETVFTLALDGSLPARSKFVSEEITKERIARLEYLFKAGTRHDIQISAEYAFNALDATVGFEDDNTPFTDENTQVEEDRYEARITDSWQISPKLSLQTSLGAEYSRLQVVEPQSDARTFFRPKGFSALSYQLSNRYAFRARAERGVGQLNFGDFISSRSLAEDRESTGNAEIKPAQFWEFSVETERTDDKYLSGTVRPFLRLIQDPIDRVQFANGTEGPGNLDDALRYGISANATLLMDELGVPGLRFEADGAVSDSEIDDPLTGETRRISSSLEWRYEVEARYDIPNTPFALTAEIENDQLAPFVRFDEIQDIRVRRPFLSIGLLHKNFLGLQVGIEASNLLDNVIERERLRFFDDDLRLGNLSQIERFERRRGRRLSIEISGTF